MKACHAIMGQFDNFGKRFFHKNWTIFQIG